MHKFIVGAAIAVAAVASPLRAQDMQPVTSGGASFYVGPYVGYMIYGDLFDFPNAEFSHDDALFYGAQAGVSFSPNFSLLGNFGYSKSNAQWESAGGTSPASADLGIFFYDAALQFRLPFGEQAGSWIAPFGQVGAGAVKYTTDTDDFNAEGKTDIAFNLGIGADFQFMRTIGVRLLARDYITSLAWDNVSTVDFDDDVEENVAHNIALTVGLNFGF